MFVKIERYKNGRMKKPTIRIDSHDCWSLDHTLAMIIHPALVQLKAQNHGAPSADDEDVPEELRSTMAKPTDWGTDENWFKRWNWVMDEMIWAFGQIAADGPDEPDWPGSAPREEWDIYQERINNALRLFGKYYRALWD